MDSPIQNLVKEAVTRMIRETVTEGKIQSSYKIHADKVHFIPIRYRVINGLLQSMNIKFGNFIEKLMLIITENDERVVPLSLSGRRVVMKMTAESDSAIDQYISLRQLPNSPDTCDEQFHQLLHRLLEYETSDREKRQTTKDVDLLFQSADGQIIYSEIKYNDDHDTGKFVDINRKFLKTYAGLINHLHITDTQQLKPIIYYFNPVKRWGPIYTPSDHVYRGPELFAEFFDISYEDVDNYFRRLGDDEDIVALFDDFYRRIRYDAEDHATETHLL